MDTPEVTGMSVRKRRARTPESGARLATARRRAGLSQQQLAERAGIRKLTVLRIENGTSRPSVDVALALSRELGQSVEALFGGGGTIDRTDEIAELLQAIQESEHANIEAILRATSRKQQERDLAALLRAIEDADARIMNWARGDR
jgi:transcriptional regulator with XRE-family HTH domain